MPAPLSSPVDDTPIPAVSGAGTKIASLQSIIMPDGRDPSPFYVGALSRKDRRTSSASVQLTFKNAFCAELSMRFHKHAGDNIHCPCNDSECLIRDSQVRPDLSLDATNDFD